MSRRIREKAWKDFDQWCRMRRLKAMPAHPWTVAAYLRWCEARHRPRTIAGLLKVIARVHLLNCHGSPDRHPTVKRTLRMIETRWRNRGRSAALFEVGDFVSKEERPKPETESETEPQPRPEPRPGGLKRSMRASPRLVRRRPI